MTANAEILIEEHKNALTVPEQAVIYDRTRKTPSSWCPIPSRKTASAKFRSRWVFPTAARPRSSPASRKATRSCCSSKCPKPDARIDVEQFPGSASVKLAQFRCVSRGRAEQATAHELLLYLG